MTRSRPFGVTLLAILAAVAGIFAFYHTLQMLGIFSISGPFGVFSFYGVSWIGALMWVVLALIYFWVARMLWNLAPQGWLFVVTLATLNLILAVISIIGESAWQAMLPSIIVNGVILLYCLMPGTKEAFGVSAETEPTGTQTRVPPVAKADTAPSPATVTAADKGSVTAKKTIVEEKVSTAPEVEAVVEEEVSPTSEVEAGVVSTDKSVEEVEEKIVVTDAAALSHDLSIVEGIGKVYKSKLVEAGVDSPLALLERGRSPQGREELAEVTGISERLILNWVGQVDLYRINGLGPQYAELLKAAGVDTIPELAQRNPENLHAKLVEVNEEHRHVGHIPSRSQVEDWVDQAKSLPRAITY